MRIVRFQAGGEPRYGVVEDDIVRELVGNVFGRFRVTRKKHPLNRIRFLSPTEPTKIVGVGLNFRGHTALDPHNAPVRAYLNADLKQSSSTANFIFDVPYMVSFITRIMPLFPGDIIATGTPSGIGPMKPGDTIEIEIEGIGRLRNTVTRQS